MAWTSILSPYGGTEMGNIATRFGFYDGGNDDLDETFFNRSVLRHVHGGPGSIEPLVRELAKDKRTGYNPLVEALETREIKNGHADLYLADTPGSLVSIGSKNPVGRLLYLSETENNRYCDQTVILQRNFNWFAKIPEGHKLAEQFVSLDSDHWTWGTLGTLTKTHLTRLGYAEKMAHWEDKFARAFGCESMHELPAILQANPHYFTFLPSGDRLAKKMVDEGVLEESDPQTMFRRLGDATRHWIYDHLLYQVSSSNPPIAKAS
jgi:hypothetical protein